MHLSAGATGLLAGGWTLFVLTLRIVALGVIPGNRKPSSGTAWLLVVLFLPVFGLILYFFIGSSRLERRRHEKQDAANEVIRTLSADTTWRPPYAELAPLVPSVIELNAKLGAIPAMPDNEVAFISDYHESIEAMRIAVEHAEVYVDVEFYIAMWDEATDGFFRELVAATERGVVVRLLLDHLGSRGIPGYKEFTRRLDATDIQWHPMLPIRPLRRRPDLRNHRKLLVVDGVVAFSGSQNLIEPGYDKPKNHEVGREWVDLTARYSGPIVRAYEAVFATDWFSETDEILAERFVARTPREYGAQSLPSTRGVIGQLVPSGPGFRGENNLRMFTTLIYSATRRISLTSPYFVPDESLLYAVTTAAQRGIEVELFVSEEADQFMVGHAQASYYRQLLEAGVRIWLYPAPAVLHGKHFTVDEDVAVIGSSNMDMRSFALNYEISTLLLGEEVVVRMREIEDGYRAVCRELTLDEWGQRPRRLKYVDNVMRLTSALQ